MYPKEKVSAEKKEDAFWVAPKFLPGLTRSWGVDPITRFFEITVPSGEKYMFSVDIFPVNRGYRNFYPSQLEEKVHGFLVEYVADNKLLKKGKLSIDLEPFRQFYNANQYPGQKINKKPFFALMMVLVGAKWEIIDHSLGKLKRPIMYNVLGKTSPIEIEVVQNNEIVVPLLS